MNYLLSLFAEEGDIHISQHKVQVQPESHKRERRSDKYTPNNATTDENAPTFQTYFDNLKSAEEFATLHREA